MSKLIALILKLIDLINFWERETRKKELNDATDKALDTKDTRILEDALGGSGDTSSTKHVGMYERTRTKKD